MIIDKSIIKKLQNDYRREFPKELIHYLMVTYKEEPFPYEYSEQDLYNKIKREITSYYAGTLDVIVKSPYKRLEEECDQWRDACICEEVKSRELNEYISELENLLLQQGIITEQMKKRFKVETRICL